MFTSRGREISLSVCTSIRYSVHFEICVLLHERPSITSFGDDENSQKYDVNVHLQMFPRAKRRTTLNWERDRVGKLPSDIVFYDTSSRHGYSGGEVQVRYGIL